MGKKVTKEERELERELERASDEAYQAATYMSEPTRVFRVGDEVRFGGMKQTTVEDALCNGKAYVLRCIATNTNYGKPYDYITYRGTSWVNVFPLRNDGKENSTFSSEYGCKLYFNNASIESLLFKHYHFGVDLDPPYQRGYVWTDSDKEALLDSVFHGIDIGKFVFVRRTESEWDVDGVYYEILDGKQRFTTLKDFYEDRFPYKGYRFSELSAKDRNTFLNKMTSIAEMEGDDKRKVLETFIVLNTGGRVMPDEIVEKVKGMLSEL